FDFNDIPLVSNPAIPGSPPEGEAPITWIGARYRHKILDKDGQRVMVKITTIPKGTRSQSWMGPTDMHDYTIQADLCGQHAPRSATPTPMTTADSAATAEKPSATEQPSEQQINPSSGSANAVLGLPDMGLIAQRYTLDLMGNSQQLQIRSWPPQV